MSTSNFGKFVAGALLGGAVGAVIGMLLAPRSGEETRTLIKEEFDARTRDVAEGLRDKSDLLKEKAAAFRDKVGDLSHELEETGRRTVSRFTDRAASAADNSTT